MLARITCPDCGPVSIKPNAYSDARPIAGPCPQCGDQLYFDTDEAPIFTHCNGCGLKLRPDDGLDMGLCRSCAWGETPMGFNPVPGGPELLEAAKAFLELVNDSRQVLSQSGKGYERKAFYAWQKEWHAAKERLTLAVRNA